MANQQVFREKSLERISSTEELRDYMRVTSPKLWMLLTVILVFLAGFIVFACFVPDLSFLLQRYQFPTGNT